MRSPAISIPVILLIGGLAALIAFAKRMRWEDIAAFIAGPVVLLLLIQSANGALKASTLPPPVESTAAQVETVAATASASGGGLFTLIALLLMAMCLGAALYLTLQAAQVPILSQLANRWGVFKNFSIPGMTRTAKHNESEAALERGPLYFETAIALGAFIAAADGHVEPREFTTLSRVFNLTDANYPDASKLYQQALNAPKSLRDILKPFTATYGKHAANSEQLIFGMTCVAMADGVMNPSELGMINLAAEGLGIPVMHAKRIVMSAGYFGEQANTSGQSQSSNSSAHTSPLRSAARSEYAQHLETLDLPLGARKSEIRTAWRRLVSKYHPDKLASQNLSAKELDKAGAKMQAVNEAYGWLKDQAP